METPHEITDIVWDGDNTLWDWVGYAVEAYEAMSQTIADETGRPEPEVAAAMKAYYTTVGTMEDERLIQGLEAAGFFKGVKNYDRDNLIHKAQGIFTKTRSKHFHLYDGIEEAFEKASKLGIRNTILSDAPSRQASLRFKRSELDPYITGLNAMPSNRQNNLPKKFRKLEKEGKYDVDFKVTELPLEKPFSNLRKILNMTREQIRRHVVIVGDNDLKDMGLVRRYSCRGILALYGHADQELLNRLLRFAPEKIAHRSAAIGKTLQKKTEAGQIVIVDDPRQIAAALKLKAA